MIRPLLHMLQRGDPSTRILAVERIAGHRPMQASRKPGALCEERIARKVQFLGWDDGQPDPFSLCALMRRYPALARLHDSTSDAAELRLASPLLVVGPGREDQTPAVLRAMSAGALVVVPDSGTAASIVRDGINGFHYRTSNPDSLALCLLTIDRLPAQSLEHIAARARANIAPSPTVRPETWGCEPPGAFA